MQSEARFVVWTHTHPLKDHSPDLNDPKTKEMCDAGLWNGFNGVSKYLDCSSVLHHDMERYGIDMAILLPSFLGTRSEQHAELAEKYPDKFRACCMDTELKLKVWRGECEWTIEACCEELEGYLKSGRYSGIGEFAADYYWWMGRKGPVKNEQGIWTAPQKEPPYTFEQRLDELRQIVSLAAKYDVPYYFHEFFSPYSFDPWKLLQRLVVEYPTAKIIIAHGGYEVFAGAQLGEHWVRQACYCASFFGHRNVYLECAQWPAEYWEIAIKDENIGASQLVWGGEWGCMPTQFTRNTSSALWINHWPLVYSAPDYMGTAITELRKVKAMGIVTQDEISLIMGGNAARLFKLPLPCGERIYPKD